MSEATNDMLKDVKEIIGEAKTEIVEQAAKAAAKSAQDVIDAQPEPRVEAETKATKQEKIQLAGRAMRAFAKAKGNMAQLGAIARELGGEKLERQMIAGTDSLGGYLVPEILDTEVIRALRAQAVVRRAMPMFKTLPHGNFNMGKIATGASAQWRGEAVDRTLSPLTISEVQLDLKYLDSMVVASEQLLRYNSVALDEEIFNDISMALGVAEDAAFLRGATGGDNPVGLVNKVAAANKFDVTKAGAVATAEEIVKDLAKALLKVAGSNHIWIRPAWFMNEKTKINLGTLLNASGYYQFPEVMENGTLMGIPIYSTNSLPSNLDASGDATNDESEIVLAEMTNVVVGDQDAMSFKVSSEASYNDSGLKSAFSRGETIFMVSGASDIQVKHDTGLAVIEAVDW